jgi:hypothetical protein
LQHEVRVLPYYVYRVVLDAIHMANVIQHALLAVQLARRQQVEMGE